MKQRQTKQKIKLKDLRHRKLTFTGGNSILTYHPKPNQNHQKQSPLQFPIIDQSPSTVPLLDLKTYEEQLSLKNNYRTMKTLIRAYDEGKRKYNQIMGGLGLDIRRCEPIGDTERKRSLNRISKYYGRIRRGAKYSDSSSKSQYLQQKQWQTDLSSSPQKNPHKPQSTESTSLLPQPESLPSTGYSTATSPLKFKQKYLYERLAGKQHSNRQQHNLVYDKRIKSYTDLLFKLQFAHNIYINLDLGNEGLGGRNRRVKYYIGPGNNGAMVRGLMKRRFWWQGSEEIGECCFVWTQIKVKSIYSKQHPSKHQPHPQYKKNHKIQQNPPQSSQRQISSPQKYPSIQKHSQQIHRKQHYNHKLLNPQDVQTYQQYYNRYQLPTTTPYNTKTRTFAYRLQKLPKLLQPLPTQDTIIHNHLPHNYHLGNKKALFYNLRIYYTLIGQDPFQYIPLTFHIKDGFKDEEYRRFVEYYNQRKNTIRKEIKQLEEEYGEDYDSKKIMRNIWIVKPGENSNQGRGITVIDQIYELNAIMKRIDKKSKSECKSIQKKNQKKNEKKSQKKKIQEKQKEKQNEDQQKNQGKRTHIVQMYIDRPFLYHNRKFDIRHYMLITNLYGIRRVYWYSDGYIRTSSYQFRIDQFEPQIHLTNDYIQKKYPEYSKYQPCNKVSYEEFQRYLDCYYSSKKYSFRNDILPKMKKIATDAAKSVCLKLAPENLENNFQIFGLDFMVDRHFRPWLIEINTNPCLEVNCPLLDRIIPYMVEQSLKLSIDVVYPPPAQYPNTSKHYTPFINLQTFKYQLIFDEQSQGQQLKKLYGLNIGKQKNRKLLNKLRMDQNELGELDDDEWFGDEGKEIKLDDFT